MRPGRKKQQNQSCAATTAGLLHGNPIQLKRGRAEGATGSCPRDYLAAEVVCRAEESKRTMKTDKQRIGTGNPPKNQGTSPPPCAGLGWVASACLLSLICSLAEAGASTPVSGFVAGGHWTSAGSPYNVVGDVQVY